MKKVLFFVCTLMLFACGGDSTGDTPMGGSEYLNVSSVDIPGGNTSATLSIQASQNCEWVITWSDSWIRSVNPTKGSGSQNVMLTVTVNPSSSAERTAVVNVSNTSGTIKRNVTVTQAPNAESLELSMTTMNFTSAVDNQDVTVASNTHWTITGIASWLTLNKTEGEGNSSVRVAVEANTTESERRAVLTFKGMGGAQRQLTVVQTGRSSDFIVTPTSISADAVAGSVNFSVSSEGRWSVQTNSSWASLSIIAGEGSKTVSVALADNISEMARTAEITISSTSKTDKVIITQVAATRPVIADIKEANLSDVDKSNATLAFSYTSIFPVTECGVCYSSVNNTPTKDNSTYLSRVASSKEGSPSVTMTGLTPGATYYVRAYAVSVVGIQYGNTVSFVTEGDWPGGDDNVTPGVK